MRLHLVAIYPDGHTAHGAYRAAVAYWDGWFGQGRDGKPKGYVEVELS